MMPCASLTRPAALVMSIEGNLGSRRRSKRDVIGRSREMRYEALRRHSRREAAIDAGHHGAQLPLWRVQGGQSQLPLQPVERHGDHNG